MISKFKPFQGPLQFVFKDPDTGVRFQEDSKKLLMDRITAYRMQNGLEAIEFLGDVLENYWCMLPENVGKCESKGLEIGVLPFIKGGITILKNYLYSKVVPQNVAEKRGEQCASCEFNKMPDNEGVRQWLDMVAINSVKGNRTKNYDKLGTCDVCKCCLNMKVFYAGTIDKPSIAEQRKYDKVKCWQLEIVK